MKKRILFIQNNLGGGGAEKVLIDILKNFDYTKYDVTLLLVQRKGIYVSNIPKEVVVKALFNSVSTLLTRVLKRMRFTSICHALHKLITLYKIRWRHFDTIISFMEGRTTIVHSYIMKYSKRNITWVHCDLKLGNWCLSDYDSFEHMSSIYQKMDDVVFVSNGAREAFNEIFHAERKTIIYNLIDRNKIRELSDKEIISINKFTICNVGRLTPPKKQDRLIEVAKILVQCGYDVEFWILGAGELENHLKTRVSEENLTEVVKFLGFVANPYPYIKAADVFLLTSDYEGFPLVVCEALCLNKPIVSTRVTGPSEILGDGSGVLCDKDAHELANSLMRLIDNRKDLEEYSVKAECRSHMFNTSDVMQQIYQVIG